MYLRHTGGGVGHTNPIPFDSNTEKDPDTVMEEDDLGWEDVTGDGDHLRTYDERVLPNGPCNSNSESGSDGSDSETEGDDDTQGGDLDLGHTCP